jgi:soluble cytochrome b562
MRRTLADKQCEILEAIQMTIKQKLLKTVQDLPDDASFEDAMEKLFLLSRIDKGLEQADQGKTYSHQVVRDRMSKWLK